MMSKAGIIAGSAAVLAALALASPVYPETSTEMGYCTAVIATGLAGPCTGRRRNAPGLTGVRMIDVDVYTGRVPIRPTLEAVKSRTPRRRLSDAGLFGCRTLG
jgi:hypothetical protein